ncbi:MAG TPA: thioredoxin [Methylocella sp.]|nr:thioredoxin [Methylocella sp.]
MSGLFGRGAGGARPANPAASKEDLGLVKDTSTAQFGNDVIVESARQPVLVDFWAPWCQPCKQLAPILEKAVKAAAGKVKLVKMNIDDYPEIPTRLGVQSIPAVIAFQRGQPVDGFMGALPEREVRGFIERLAGPIEEADPLAEAQALVEAGDAEGAAELYAAVLSENPGNPAAAGGLAKLLIGAGDLDNARKLLGSVAEGASQDKAILGAKAALELAEQATGLGNSGELLARLATHPEDHQARFDLALLLNAQNQRAEAAAELLEIIKCDRTWNEDGARKQLLQFFEAWGFTDPASVAARKKLSSLLFS